MKPGSKSKLSSVKNVIGFAKDPTGVAALYLGKKEGKKLDYMGKVGTGWSRSVSSKSGSSSTPS